MYVSCFHKLIIYLRTTFTRQNKEYLSLVLRDIHHYDTTKCKSWSIKVLKCDIIIMLQFQAKSNFHFKCDQYLMYYKTMIRVWSYFTFRNQLTFDNILHIKLILYLDLKSTIYIMIFINTQGQLVSALLHLQEKILSRVHIHSLWVLIILWDKLYTSEEEIVNLLNHFKSCLRKVYQVKWSKCEI